MVQRKEVINTRHFLEVIFMVKTKTALKKMIMKSYTMYTCLSYFYVLTESLWCARQGYDRVAGDLEPCGALSKCIRGLPPYSNMAPAKTKWERGEKSEWFSLLSHTSPFFPPLHLRIIVLMPFIYFAHLLYVVNIFLYQWPSINYSSKERYL